MCAFASLWHVQLQQGAGTGYNRRGAEEFKKINNGSVACQTWCVVEREACVRGDGEWNECSPLILLLLLLLLLLLRTTTTIIIKFEWCLAGNALFYIS